MLTLQLGQPKPTNKQTTKLTPPQPNQEANRSTSHISLASLAEEVCRSRFSCLKMLYAQIQILGVPCGLCPVPCALCPVCALCTLDMSYLQCCSRVSPTWVCLPSPCQTTFLMLILSIMTLAFHPIPCCRT
jgi:hypothetical protein